jgi:hypothetical protein
VQLSAASCAATPNQLLAALVETGCGPAATFYPSTYPSTLVTPADLSAAIAALVGGHTTAVIARMAGVQADADPTAANAGDITLWGVGLAGLGGSTANAGWTVNNSFPGENGITLDAAGILQTANQLGPLTFVLNNIGTISFSQNPDPTAPAGARPVFNAADMSSWVVGLAGLGASTGTVGWIVNNTFGSGDGGAADATGILQTANQFGPFVFNLNVLKAISFIQPPNGTVLPDGQLDAIHAVDIGQWVVGIPGLFVNTGTVGFVADRGYGVGFGTGGWVGGLQTTTQIGPLIFTFNFLPAISFGGPPPTITPFASDPPPPNVTSSAGTSTGTDTGMTSAGDEMTAFTSVEIQPTGEPWEGSAWEDADAGNEADPAGDGSRSTEAMASTAASPLATTTVPAIATETLPAANGPLVTDQPTQTSRQTPAETTNPAGATTPNADSNPDGARHSAAASASPIANSPNGDIGKHGSGDAYVGKHRSDDGYIGRHRSDNGSLGSQTSSGTDDSESTG